MKKKKNRKIKQKTNKHETNKTVIPSHCEILEIPNLLYKDFLIFKNFTMRRNNSLIGSMFFFFFNFSILLFFHFKGEILYDSFAKEKKL